MQQTFAQALDYIKHMPAKAQPGQPELSNEQKLQFYGLFKQATDGENKTKSPSRLKVVQRMKWTAWQKNGKISKQQAMENYVQKLTKLAPAWNGSAKL